MNLLCQGHAITMPVIVYTITEAYKNVIIKGWILLMKVFIDCSLGFGMILVKYSISAIPLYLSNKISKLKESRSNRSLCKDYSKGHTQHKSLTVF